MQTQVRTYVIVHIITLLRTNNRAVEKAMVVLHNRNNNIKNKAFSASNTAYYASWVNAGRPLSGIHLKRARDIALSNVGTLLQAAEEKAKTHTSM